MISPHGFICTPVGDKRYANTKLIGGMELIVSTSEEDHHYSNRFATVIEPPLRYGGPIKKGDTLLVHHNVFKIYNNMKGKRSNGKSFLDENTFLVDFEQFFMYKNETGWHTHDRYCFVKPIAARESVIIKPGNEEPLMGEMKYSNDYLVSKGVLPGNIVCFTPDSEYEFKVDGEKLYRVYDHQIVAKYE